MSDLGSEIHQWISDLFPVCRSITGDGNRETLGYLKQILPPLEIFEVPSGTPSFDWVVPLEWNINGAWIEDEGGNRLIDFAESNLHVVGYSEPIDKIVTRQELERHLHSIPEQPDAIPFIFSPYERTWGFCISERQRAMLGEGPFHVVIDSRLESGSMSYGELRIKGTSDAEVLFSANICHPSLANNELSGPTLITALARELLSRENLNFSYRFLFLPETIGSLYYLSQHLNELKKNVIAGWVVTCVGDDKTYSFVPSRLGNTLSDRVSELVLKEQGTSYTTYKYLDRGSDERQWCAPGIDLPVSSIMRSKYGTYPEYHTSLDNLEFVSPEGLGSSFDLLSSCIEIVENNARCKSLTLGEPQLGRRGLYPNLSTTSTAMKVRSLRNVWAYCDGDHDLVSICERTGETSQSVIASLKLLKEHSLIREIN